MQKIITIILFTIFLTNAWINENYTGYGDTSTVANFYSDTTLYSKWFRHSSYQNLRVEVLFDDTSSAGFLNDSVCFIWGLQTGHPILNSGDTLDTAICKQWICLDTASRFDSTWNDTIIQYGTDGTFNDVLKQTDTASVKGFARQGAQPAINWDCLVRGWAKGKTGNKKASKVKLRWNFLWRSKDE